MTTTDTNGVSSAEGWATCSLRSIKQAVIKAEHCLAAPQDIESAVAQLPQEIMADHRPRLKPVVQLNQDKRGRVHPVGIGTEQLSLAPLYIYLGDQQFGAAGHRHDLWNAVRAYRHIA